MAKKKIEIELDEQVADIAEDGAAIQGETLSTLVEMGQPGSCTDQPTAGPRR